MSYRVNAFPDMTRSDAAVALFDTWNVGTPERQHAVVNAITGIWEGRAWPTADLLSYSIFPGLEGDSLLTDTQWAGGRDSQELARAWKDEVDAVVPGVRALRYDRVPVLPLPVLPHPRHRGHRVAARLCAIGDRRVRREQPGPATGLGGHDAHRSHHRPRPPAR